MSTAVIAIAFAASMSALSPSFERAETGEVGGMDVHLARRDPYRRVDRRQQHADVADVGAAERPRHRRLLDGASQLRQVATERVRHRPVRPQRRVLDVVPAILQAGAGGRRAGLEAGDDASLQVLQVRLVFGARQKDGRRVVGHDVRHLAAVGDDAVDAGAVADVLSQGGDGVVGDDNRVEGVDARFRPAGGVRLFAEVLDAHGGAGEGGRQGDVARPRVDEHCRVELVEGAATGHYRLAAVDLLRRRADGRDAPARLRQNATHRDRGAGRAGGDEVVAAGVAEAAEGIVLGEEGDARSLFAAGGAKGGREVAEGAFDAEVVLLQVVAEPAAGLLFLEAGLGVVVDAVAEVDESVPLRLDLVDNAGLQAIGVLRHVILCEWQDSWASAL